MKRRLVGIVFMALILAATITAVLTAPGGALEILRLDWAQPAAMAVNLELFLKENLPFSQELKDIFLTVQVTGGQSEFDGLILVENSLVENFFPLENTLIRQKNGRAIEDFVQSGETPAYLMLLPTACAVYQEKLPGYISLYNQRSYLEEISRQFAGSMSIVDTYLPLYYARDRYLYYRTSPDLTALGQYTVYQTLAKRLGFSPRGMEEFELRRMADAYYGPFYDRWQYSGVKGDVVTYYRNTALGRAYRVVHWERYEQRTYYTLFPEEAALEGDVTAVLLGGDSPRIEITALGAAGAPSLLMVGDESSLGVLPFLALHYQRITFVNLGLLTESEIAAIPADGYDHLLFAYSLDTYMNTAAPAKVAGLGSEAVAPME